MRLPRLLAVTSTLTSLIAVMALDATPAAAWQPPARKDCYEGFSSASGCPWKGNLAVREMRALSCQNLAHVRNRIYDQNGYCFAKPELKAQYNQDGCRIRIQALVPLNRFERENVKRIRQVEREKGCG